MSYEHIKRRLDNGEILVLDGATGTELQRRGVAMDPAAWCGPATLENDDVLSAIHVDYIRAGSDVVTANTYASSRLMLSPAEKPEFNHPASILYYQVDDILEAFETLRSRGVVFEGEPHIVAKMPAYDLWMAFFRDSEGNTLAAMSEQERDAA